MKATHTVVSAALLLLASGVSAQLKATPDPVSVELGGRVITVPSPLVVDSREVDPLATPLRFDATYFNAIDRADRVNIKNFPLDRTTMVDLELENFESFSPNAVVIQGTVDGEVQAPRSAIATMRGSIVGIPDSRVFLAVSPLMSNGIIEIGDTTYIVSNGSFERETGISIYNMTDLPAGKINWLEYGCTLLNVPGRNSTAMMGGDGDDVMPDCRIINMAIETDNEFSRLFGTDPSIAGPATQQYVDTLVGGVTTIYTEQWNGRLSVIYHRMFPDPNALDPWEGNDTPTVLGEMNSVWTSFSAPIDTTPIEDDWHGAHLFSGKPLGGGIAYLAAICDRDFAQAVSGNLNGFFPNPLESNNQQNWDIIVTSHEWGHNFGAPHTHGLNPPHDLCGLGNCDQAANGTIMSYCHLCPGGYENIELVFAPRILSDAILPYVTLEMPRLDDCNVVVLNDAECAGLEDCPADVNGDGVLERADFTYWIVAYNTGDLAADCNRNGTLEPADFSAWLASYSNGCYGDE